MSLVTIESATLRSLRLCYSGLQAEFGSHMAPKCSFHEGFYASEASPRSNRSTLAAAAAGSRDVLAAAKAGGCAPMQMDVLDPSSSAALAPATERPVAARGGYGGLAKPVVKSGGGYGKLGSGGGGGGSGGGGSGGGGSSSSNGLLVAPPLKKALPKSANFARQLTGLAVKDDEDERPQSARAAVRSWSDSGGMRDATFRKKSGHRTPSSVGFATVLAAADLPWRHLDPAGDDEDAGGAVALLMEELILQASRRPPAGPS